MLRAIPRTIRHSRMLYGTALPPSLSQSTLQRPLQLKFGGKPFHSHTHTRAEQVNHEKHDHEKDHGGYEDGGSSARFERDLKLLVGEAFAADERVRALARQVQVAYDAFLQSDFVKSRRIYDETTTALEEVLLGGSASATSVAVDSGRETESGSDSVARQRKMFPLLAFAYNNLAEAIKSVTKYVDLSSMKGETDVDPSDGYRYRYSLNDVVMLYDRALDVWGYDRSSMTESKDAGNLAQEKEDIDMWSEEEKQRFHKLFMREMGALYNNIGLYHMEETNMLQDSMQWFKRAEEKRRELIEHYPEETEFKTSLGVTLNNIAQCFSRLREHGKAMKSYRKAGDIFQQAVDQSIDNYSPVHIVVLNNIGLGYFNRKETPTAMHHFDKALELITRHEKATGTSAGEELGITLSNIASVDLQRKMYPEAENFFRQALANFRKNLNPNHPNIAECCSQLATAMVQNRRTSKPAENVDKEADKKEIEELAKEAKRIAEFHKQRRNALRSTLQESATTEEGQKKRQQKAKPKSRFAQMFGRRSK